MPKVKKTQEKKIPSSLTSVKKDEGKISKKEKRETKHLTLFQKLEKLKKIQQDEKDSKIRKPFSLKVLDDVLPAIRDEFEKKKKNNTNILQKASQNFSEVVDHPQFKSNPLATIREHLTNNFENIQQSLLQKQKESSFRKTMQNQIDNPKEESERDKFFKSQKGGNKNFGNKNNNNNNNNNENKKHNDKKNNNNNNDNKKNSNNPQKDFKKDFVNKNNSGGIKKPDTLKQKSFKNKNENNEATKKKVESVSKSVQTKDSEGEWKKKEKKTRKMSVQ